MIKGSTLYRNNSIIGYENINILQNKNINVREIITKAPLDVLCVEETKLEDSFLNSQFISKISNDRSSTGVGKLVYVRQGITLKRREKFENKTCETICIELFPKNGVLYFTQPPK